MSEQGDRYNFPQAYIDRLERQNLVLRLALADIRTILVIGPFTDIRHKCLAVIDALPSSVVDPQAGAPGGGA